MDLDLGLAQLSTLTCPREGFDRKSATTLHRSTAPEDLNPTPFDLDGFPEKCSM